MTTRLIVLEPLHVDHYRDCLNWFTLLVAEIYLDNTASTRIARIPTTHRSTEAVSSAVLSTGANYGDELSVVDSKLEALMPQQLTKMDSIAHRRDWFATSPSRLLLHFGIMLTLIQCIGASTNYSNLENWQAKFIEQTPRRQVTSRGPPRAGDDTVPLVITNRCDTTIWPGTATQAGLGPGTGGFELNPGESKNLSVGSNWQGRVWGRTNCTVNGDSCACQTGDCFAKLDCDFSVSSHSKFVHQALLTSIGRRTGNARGV